MEAIMLVLYNSPRTRVYNKILRCLLGALKVIPTINHVGSYTTLTISESTWRDIHMLVRGIPDIEVFSIIIGGSEDND